MDVVTLVGSLAAICSMVSFGPQAWKIIRTRETKDISLGMYAFTVFGFMCWTTYGVLLEQWPLIVANGVCLALSAFILMMKILPKRSKEVVAETLGAKDSKPS